MMSRLKPLQWLSTLIAGLDHTMQGQGSAAIKQFQFIIDVGPTPL
jgi:hypothetical protein